MVVFFLLSGCHLLIISTSLKYRTFTSWSMGKREGLQRANETYIILKRKKRKKMRSSKGCLLTDDERPILLSNTLKFE